MESFMSHLKTASQKNMLLVDETHLTYFIIHFLILALLHQYKELDFQYRPHIVLQKNNQNFFFQKHS